MKQWAAKLRARNISDFTCWKDPDQYKKGPERVLRDLRGRSHLDALGRPCVAMLLPDPGRFVVQAGCFTIGVDPHPVIPRARSTPARTRFVSGCSGPTTFS